MRLITLLTDFSEKDGYAGIMKGVMLSIAPHARIVDLSHDISPQNVLEAALLLGRSAAYFPDGTIHVAVVDPGVGTHRRGIAARLGEQYFVGPDNGLMTLLYRNASSQHNEVKVVHLDQPKYWLTQVSRTFHGRDIFAPVAAHLANGVELDSLGKTVTDPVLLPIPSAECTQSGWQGEVIHRDAFDNLATNIREEDLPGDADIRVHIKGKHDLPVKLTFGEQKPGELVAVIDSFGYLMIGVVNGSAAQLLGADVGEKVEVVCSPKAAGSQV